MQQSLETATCRAAVGSLHVVEDALRIDGKGLAKQTILIPEPLIEAGARNPSRFRQIADRRGHKASLLKHLDCGGEAAKICNRCGEITGFDVDV